MDEVKQSYCLEEIKKAATLKLRKNKLPSQQIAHKRSHTEQYSKYDTDFTYQMSNRHGSITPSQLQNHKRSQKIRPSVRAKKQLHFNVSKIFNQSQNQRKKTVRFFALDQENLRSKKELKSVQRENQLSQSRRKKKMQTSRKILTSGKNRPRRNYSQEKDMRMKIQVLSENDMETWKKELTRICSYLKQLISYGISQKKVSKWCTNYFQQKKKGLINLFMLRKMSKKSLCDQMYNEAIFDETALMAKVIGNSNDLNDKEKYFLGIQITQYRRFLQQLIAMKQKLELTQIQDKIKHNLGNMYLKTFARQMPSPSAGTQINGFYNQLERLEQKHGRLHLLSLKNRKRYQNITESQQKIWQMIHS